MVGQLLKTVGKDAVFWLVAGGLSYSLGTAFYTFGLNYSKQSFRRMHDIFHIFVLGGSVCHFWMINRYIMHSRKGNRSPGR